MIAAQTTHVLESTIEGETTAFTLDQDSLVKLMKMYTDLYSDRPLAVIREISTNALDSHADAGNPDPILVTLPTPLDPYFRVQDFGTGLDANDFKEIYTKFGKSTRSNSNAFAGMMGLGSKAPLTYTQQFTIRSVKAGVRYEALVTRNEQGIGELTVVDKQPTDDPNGVFIEIMVGSGDVQTFRQRAENFYRFWKPGTVLVDGEPPKHIEGTKVGDDLLIIQDRTRRSYVVMGNVPYPLPQNGPSGLNLGLTNGHTLVAYVDIGAVSIPPSREGLSDDKHTTDALRAIEEKFKLRIAQSIQRDINKCRSPYQAIASLVKWKHMLPSSASPTFARYTFQGHALPEKVDLPANSWIVPHTPPTRRGSGGMTSCEEETALQADALNKRIIFTGWTYSKFSATMRKKLDKWVRDNDLKDGSFHYILVPTPNFKSRWFDDALVFPWEDVKKTKLDPKDPNAESYGDRYREYRIPGSFDVITEDGVETGFAADEIDQDEPLFYYDGRVWDAQRYDVMVTHVHRTGTIVAVPSNRKNKFLRDFPTAKPVRPAAEAAAKLWLSTLDTETLRAMRFQEEQYKTIVRVRALDLSKLDDPSIHEYMALANTDVTADRNRYNAFKRACPYGVLGGIYEGIEYPENPLLKYDLYPNTPYGGGLERFKFDHFYIYANAFYATLAPRLDTPVYSD